MSQPAAGERISKPPVMEDVRGRHHIINTRRNNVSNPALPSSGGVSPDTALAANWSHMRSLARELTEPPARLCGGANAAKHRARAKVWLALEAGHERGVDEPICAMNCEKTTRHGPADGVQRLTAGLGRSRKSPLASRKALTRHELPRLIDGRVARSHLQARRSAA